jgi:D-arabinose 1-dehydrogenase-like Zn-dependent alcohol dehydrogenase
VLVVSGATSGGDPPAELRHIFFRQLSVLGSTMGTREELERLLLLCVGSEIRPLIDDVMPLAQARRGFETLLAGDVLGKIVFTV